MISRNDEDEDILELVRELVLGTNSFDEGVSALMRQAKDLLPLWQWEMPGSLNYETDLLGMTHWLTNMLNSDPPPDNIIAFWFGLFIGHTDSRENITVYLSGSPQFDEDNADWACWGEGTYIPDGRYIRSEVLDDLYEYVVKQDSSIEYIGVNFVCFGYACLLVRWSCDRAAHYLTFVDGRKFFVAIGFDDGDPLFIGVLTGEGLGVMAVS